jgi:hypothetical protein
VKPIDQNPPAPQNFAMKRCVILSAVLWSQFFSPLSLAAQDNKTAAQPPGPSLQQQVDELKESQQRILKELAEIRKLLQEKTARVDYGTEPTPSGPISLDVHGELYRGDSRARVAIIEYSDFDCSFCSKYVRDVYPRIEKEYIQSGKLKYFFETCPELATRTRCSKRVPHAAPANRKNFGRCMIVCSPRKAIRMGAMWSRTRRRSDSMSNNSRRASRVDVTPKIFVSAWQARAGSGCMERPRF